VLGRRARTIEGGEMMNFQFRRDQMNLIAGLMLIVLGGIFLAGQFLDLQLSRYLWPLFIIIPGLLLFYFMISGGKAAAPFAIPGSLVTAVGLLLLYQSATNHWESWAYAWALIFPTSFGVGLAIMGMRSDQEGLRRAGEGFIKVGIIVFLVGGMFFELIIGFRGVRANQLLLPVLLIVFGGYTILRQLWSGRSPTADHAPKMDVPSIDVLVEEAETKSDPSASDPSTEE
jgi:hypothetical protein